MRTDLVLKCGIPPFDHTVVIVLRVAFWEPSMESYQLDVEFRGSASIVSMETSW